MSDTVILALIASVTSTVGLVVGVVAQFKLKTIHALTNSNLTAVKAALATAETRIETLTAMVSALTGRTVPP